MIMNLICINYVWTWELDTYDYGRMQGIYIRAMVKIVVNVYSLQEYN